MTATGMRLDRESADSQEGAARKMKTRKKKGAHIASDTMTNTHRGTMAKYEPMVMKLEPKVYMVGVHALGMESARRTVMNLPNPPIGESTASISPPTLLPSSKPAFQEGTRYAQAAKIAPRKWTVTYMPIERSIPSRDWAVKLAYT